MKLCRTANPFRWVAGYFDAPGASEAALMVATGQKDTFNNVVMVFCNIDGYAHSTQKCYQLLCMCISLARPIQCMYIKHEHQLSLIYAPHGASTLPTLPCVCNHLSSMPKLQPEVHSMLWQRDV